MYHKKNFWKHFVLFCIGAVLWVTIRTIVVPVSPTGGEIILAAALYTVLYVSVLGPVVDGLER